VADLISVPAVTTALPFPLPPTIFPVGPGAWNWSAGQPARFPEPRGKRVLVIDDDAEISNVVREILEDEGYEVALAAEGGAALKLLSEKTHQPDLILLDMRMPGVNGWDFATAYRQRPGPHAPLVTMTAAHDAQAWAREIDAAGVLGKPFELVELLDIVERLTAAN
jgi:CheY-like chemotaxis protein